ncbi:MAG: hypothetical protein A2Y40_09445 [Candidatus Margulisbacteria bacterium GWF2_35_9]|nr:MAG: hypothetical protein A2Y40_09445 [Candidatus Margulisbacteria bacterium GWF2_35_9]
MFSYSIDGFKFTKYNFATKFKAIVQAILDHHLKVDDSVFIFEKDGFRQKFLITPKQIILAEKKQVLFNERQKERDIEE